MASIPITVLPEAGPAAEPRPADELTVRADEMFARRLDTEFAAGIRDLLHNPETGLSSLRGEAALEAIASVYPVLEELRQRTLDGAMGPRQRGLLEPLVNTRLDWAAGAIGRLAERATVQVDDESVAERLMGLGQDAAESWDDPAHLRTLGRAAVSELRWQGERRGWDPTETDARAKAGLSDLYGGAVEAAIGHDLDGATSLLAHAREVIDPARLETIDHRLARAREDGFLREVAAALSALPLDPAAPPALETFSEYIAGLTPGDATEEVRGRFGELAVHAQRRAERQWHRQQAEAGIAALDWLKQNRDASSLFLPGELREWLAADQLDGLTTLEQQGRLVTDPDLFERLDRQSAYEPEAFAALDLDRHRLSLDDHDNERFAAAQKAIVEGTTDPAVARHRWARMDADRALERQGIDTESPEAANFRADVRGRLDDFEAIEGRPATGADIDAIVTRAVGGMSNDVASMTSTRPDASKADETATAMNLDTEIVDWLTASKRDGELQTERPPPDLWNRLTEPQREAVDILLVQNAKDTSDIHRASDPTDASNDNTRNYVCTQAAYSCLSNTPDDTPPRWRESCIGAETLCNQVVNQSRAKPFGRTIILNFPDHSRVIVPQGKAGGVFVPSR